MAESGEFGIGAFTISVTGMPLNQDVYFRAFATNAQGTDFTSQSFVATLPVDLVYFVVE